MNIKRGLKRIWIVGSTLWIFMGIVLSISYFPKQPEIENIATFEELSYLLQNKNLTGEQRVTLVWTLAHLPEGYQKLPNEEAKETLENARKRLRTKSKIDEQKYEKQKLNVLLYWVLGLCFVGIMWGLLYIGFWIASGFRENK